MRIGSTNRWLIGTFIGLVAALLVVLWQLRPTYDLAFFLPAPTTDQETVLVERLGQGAGARLIFIELTAAVGADALTQSERMKELLGASELFLRVENGQREISTDAIPAALWRWRYLLGDIDWSEAGIRSALEQRIGDLSAMGGPELSRLIAQDPLWGAVQVLERLQLGGASGQPRWSDGPARAFLIAETVAPPFDLASQHRAIDAIRSAHRAAAGNQAGLELYGVGVYGARAQGLVQREAQLLGLMASAIVLLIISFAYRSFRLTLISVVPLASAVLGGLIVSSLVFGKIHGITIAFGATLMGVVDDYPMHLFSHSRHMSAREGVRSLFGTLLASAATAIVAYASLVVSGSHGLAQLGVFSLSGILCAMTATCWLLPKLMQAAPVANGQDASVQQFRLSPWTWLPLLALAVVAIMATGGIRWNDNLGELTPLPASLLARDHEMRQRFGAPDVRHLISISAGSAESALEQTEVLERQLADARERGLVRSWSTVTAVLPSAATQARRRAAIPATPDLQARLEAARTALPLRADAFAPFLVDAAASRELPTVRANDYVGGFLGDYVASHLTESHGQWRSVVYLTGLESPAALAKWLSGVNQGAEVVDLKAASESLMRGYRIRLFSTLSVALALIAVLVVWSTGSVGRFVWTAGTVAASVLATLAMVKLLHGSVTLFHMVSLILVAGLGVDYCLFYSRPQVSRTGFLDTRHAVIACAASTTGGFAILWTSSIPLLSTIGVTVAIGTFTMFVVARLGCRAL